MVGLFPTDADDLDEVTNANGTTFRYDAGDDKWVIIPNVEVYTEAEVDALIAAVGGLSGIQCFEQIQVRSASSYSNEIQILNSQAVSAQFYINSDKIDLTQNLIFHWILRCTSIDATFHTHKYGSSTLIGAEGHAWNVWNGVANNWNIAVANRPYDFPHTVLPAEYDDGDAFWMYFVSQEARTLNVWMCIVEYTHV